MCTAAVRSQSTVQALCPPAVSAMATQGVCIFCQALRCSGGSSSFCCIEVPPTHGTSLQRQRVLRRKTLMLHYLPLSAVAHQACARSTQMPPAHGKKPKAL